MSSPTLRAFCGLAVLAALAGCETVEQQMAAPVAEAMTVERDPLMFIFNGRPANDALSSAPNFHAALAAFGVDRPTRGSDLQWIRRIRGQSGNEQSPYLKSVGGILGRGFLQAGEQTLGLLDNYEEAIQYVSHGEILDYQYNADGSGVIEVATYYELPDGPPGKPARTAAYRFRVTVGAGGFSVHPKNTSNPNDVFPGTIPISATKAQNVNFKLWAKGTTIQVTDVWRDVNIPPGQSANFVRLPNAGPFASLYQTDASSCIDMMFAMSPPATLPPGTSPPLYCLGRCDSPLIINTK